jgi:hypothetical protein
MLVGHRAHQAHGNTVGIFDHRVARAPGVGQRSAVVRFCPGWLSSHRPVAMAASEDMTRVVHALVQDTDDVDAIASQAVE